MTKKVKFQEYLECRRIFGNYTKEMEVFSFLTTLQDEFPPVKY